MDNYDLSVAVLTSKVARCYKFVGIKIDMFCSFSVPVRDTEQIYGNKDVFKELLFLPSVS